MSPTSQRQYLMEIDALKSKLAEAEAESLEQARILGMSAERECTLRGKLEMVERELAELKGSRITHDEWYEVLNRLAATEKERDLAESTFGYMSEKVNSLCKQVATAEKERDTFWIPANKLLSERLAATEKERDELHALAAARLEQMQEDRKQALAWRDRVAGTEALLQQYREALELIYDIWENGPQVFENPDEYEGACGRAVDLSEDDENKILKALATTCPTAALNNAITDWVMSELLDYQQGNGAESVEAFMARRAKELQS